MRTHMSSSPGSHHLSVCSLQAGSASAFVSMPQVGQLCIAKNSDSGNWYRAEVMKLLPDRMVRMPKVCVFSQFALITCNNSTNN